jgi:radical SAM protein with 4Fe4S-binding SPASM domain
MDAYNKKLAKGLVEAYDLAMALGVYEDRVARKADDFAEHMFRSVDCGAVGNQLVVEPNGDISFCHASSAYTIGSVRNPEFIVFDHPEILKWEQALPLWNPRCQDCPAIAICGYGCFHHVLELEKPLEEGDGQFCLHTKAVMEYLLWQLYEHVR